MGAEELAAAWAGADQPAAAMADAVLHPADEQSRAREMRAGLPCAASRPLMLLHGAGPVIDVVRPAILMMKEPTGEAWSQRPDAMAAMLQVKPMPAQYWKDPVVSCVAVTTLAAAVPTMPSDDAPATTLVHVAASRYDPALVIALALAHTDGKLAVRLPALQNSGPGET